MELNGCETMFRSRFLLSIASTGVHASDCVETRSSTEMMGQRPSHLRYGRDPRHQNSGL